MISSTTVGNIGVQRRRCRLPLDRVSIRTTPSIFDSKAYSNGSMGPPLTLRSGSLGGFPPTVLPKAPIYGGVEIPLLYIG